MSSFVKAASISAIGIFLSISLAHYVRSFDSAVFKNIACAIEKSNK